MIRERRRVLLLEPNYKNKYPPIGLMKLATYHRNLGDDVVFFKGDLREFVLEKLTFELVHKLNEVDNSLKWEAYHFIIKKYIKTGKKEILQDIVVLSQYELLVANWLTYYKNIYKKKDHINYPKWDRICITTLFTFHWKITIETIEFAKKLLKDQKELLVGGVMATVLADEVEKETGIRPFKGLLDRPGILDDNKVIIDNLPLDYSILDEIDYKYPENDAYHGYMTRGCIRKCSFCAVPKLEPTFQSFVPLKKQIAYASKVYGEKRNLLLLDNNVLASDCFTEIIEEIKQCGFEKGATYIEPNLLDISMSNLESGLNDHAYIVKCFDLIHRLLKKVKGQSQQELYDLLDDYKLLSIETATKSNLLTIYPKIKGLFEKHRYKRAKARYVDFNQGVDARLLVADENKMKLLSEIAIRPLRIAFDNIKIKDIYVKAIRLSSKYGINKFSNYLLYNEKDHPFDLYDRLEINIKLSEELNVDIYSFPMKYHPIGYSDGIAYFKNRNYVGQFWNRKFIRAIQTILNATKGKIGVGSSFFYAAFGENKKQFIRLLYMPEVYILHRNFFQDIGKTDKWESDWRSLSKENRKIARKIIENNDFYNLEGQDDELVSFITEHYRINRDDILKKGTDLYALKQEYDQMKNNNETHNGFRHDPCVRV